MAEKGRLTVSDIILPSTPPAVAERYLTLAARARETSFGLLEEDIIMLDTESTGLSIRDNNLIEIAAAKISGREIVDTYQTLVYPGELIPEVVQNLCGITNADVADAPSAAEAVAGLVDFVGGLPVVAHNASFDRGLIEKVPQGPNVTDTWIDSLSLSRIALPRLTTHALANMAEAFGCASVTHRAMADVEALVGMWRIMLLGLTDMPAGLMERLATMHPETDWSLRPIFSQLAPESYGASFSMRDVRSQLVSDVSAPKKDDPFEDPVMPCDLKHSVDVAFSDDGFVSKMYADFEARPEQVEMSRMVAESFDRQHNLAIEAGTGVGKSVAYLVPAIRLAQETNVTVGVATKTNNLTDQLVSKELPALDGVLPNGVRYCSIKGYEHYLCLRKLDLATVRDLPLDLVQDRRTEHAIEQDMLGAIAVTMTFACQSAEGDIDALGIRWRSVPRDLLTTAHNECLKSRCPYYPNSCFVHGARKRRSAAADIVVTNHSLLLRNIDLDGALLPPVRYWIVDEAHSFESEARRQWAKELTSELSQAAFLELGGTSSGVIHSLLARTAELDGRTLVAGLLTKAAAKTLTASMAMSQVFEAIQALYGLSKRNRGYEVCTLWIDENVRRSNEWFELEKVAGRGVSDLEEAVKALDEAMEALTEESPQMATELSDATTRLKDILDALRLIVLEPDDAYVYSAEFTLRRKKVVHERLVAEKLDVGADLAENFYPESSSVVYTSATIAVGDSLEYFDHSVGFDRIEASQHRDVRLRSSFDFDRNMSVIVARDMPQPDAKEYLDALIELLFDVHTSMEGSVLTLFTNRREMEQAYNALEDRLRQKGLKVAMQDRRSSPRRLAEQFVADESMSLFALKSFWEGFDAAGDTLRCVVIPKLPFANPNDPLVLERGAREKYAWWRYSLPEAVLSVRQAAGRLIRTSTDTGVLVLADSRIVTRKYGSTIIDSLPSSSVQMLEGRNVGRYIRLWRAAH